jgi:transcription-repair coupling factor (superfamily II helicase)
LHCIQFDAVLDKGFQFSPDSYLQNELESSLFMRIHRIKLINAEVPKATGPWIDFVVVGFGKTEVIRAAFKAVDNGKQVAILVPTTYQHYRTFTERLICQLLLDI